MALQTQGAELIRKLVDPRNQGKVVWKETGDENTFLTSVSKFVVTITKIPDDTFHFAIRDQSGRAIDETQEDWRGGDFNNLVELWGIARRVALKTDQVYAEILSTLD